MKKHLFFLFLFIIIPGVSDAFIPQTPHLLYLVINKIKRPAGIEIVQTKMLLSNGTNENRLIELEEKLFYLYQNQLRSEIVFNIRSSPSMSFDAGTDFCVESDFEFVKVKDNLIVTYDKSPIDHYSDILLYRDHEALLNQLVFADVDTGRVSLQRYNDTVCYVIGSQFEDGRPFAGLWIEKDTFFPVKYVIKKDNHVIKFFYDNWQIRSKTWYPMHGSVLIDDQLFAMINVKTFELRSDFSINLFDIRHIEQLYQINNSKQERENG